MEATIGTEPKRRIPKRLRAGQVNRAARLMGEKIVDTTDHAGLSVPQEQSLRETLRRQTPSEPWVDAQFIETHANDADGHPVRLVHYRHNQFPPGGSSTGMVWCNCASCRKYGTERGKLTPPSISTKDGESAPMCLDKVPRRYHEAWGPSPSARAIRGVELANGPRLVQEELPGESMSELRREIRRYKAWVSRQNRKG